MNSLTHYFTIACAVGGIACVAAILLYLCRRQLRQLHDRWMALSPTNRVAAVFFVTVAVLFGGTKPNLTNDVGTVTGEDPTTNEILGVGNRCRCRADGQLSFSLEQEPNLHSTPTPSLYTSLPPSTFISLTAWTARGAFCDWQRIDFPDGFAFPAGTNLLTGVTVFAYGEIRESLHCSPSSSTFACSLPTAISLEPDASSFSYGLTASNSFVFSWQNCCVNREATNRVDASVELFRNGTIAITTNCHPPSANSPSLPTTICQLPTPPEGFVGLGQDTNWLASAFSSTDYAAITNKGYDAWLDEDYVGYNEENGHYKATITVSAMPPNGEPCYLVCGPYKVIVTQPGAYSFPLEVLNEYTARTYPTAVPLSIAYDEGYYGEEDTCGMLAAPLLRSGGMAMLGAPSPNIYTVCMLPQVHLFPSIISAANAVGTTIRIWCNKSQVTWKFASWVDIGMAVTFDSRNQARILNAITTHRAAGIIYDNGYENIYGEIELIPDSDPNAWDPTNSTNSGSSPTNGTSSGTSP